MKNYKLLGLCLLCASGLSFPSYTQEESTNPFRFTTWTKDDSLYIDFSSHFDYNTTLKITDEYNREVWKTTICPDTKHLRICSNSLKSGNYMMKWVDIDEEIASHTVIISH